MQQLQKFETRILLDLKCLFRCPEERPLRIMFIASYPLNVRRAVLNEPNPIAELTNRFIARWSCSTILLRYLTLRSSVVSPRVWSLLSESIAGGNHRILIYIYDSRLLVMRRLQSFAEEPFCRPCIPLGAEHKVQSVAKRIHGPIEILPLSLHLDIRFIHSPRIICGFQMNSASFVQLGGVSLNPPMHRCIVYHQTPQSASFPPSCGNSRDSGGTTSHTAG